MLSLAPMHRHIRKFRHSLISSEVVGSDLFDELRKNVKGFYYIKNTSCL